jgi:DNA-binding CsgD family transcriptional regulator
MGPARPGAVSTRFRDLAVRRRHQRPRYLADRQHCVRDRHQPHAEALGAEAGLSPRESEVLALVAQGLGNQDIAHRLFLSVNSVKRYIRSAYREIEDTSRARAVKRVRSRRLPHRLTTHTETRGRRAASRKSRRAVSPERAARFCQRPVESDPRRASRSLRAARRPPTENYLANRPAQQAVFLRNFRRALATPDGFVRDNLSWGASWDFDPAAVTAPVVLLYGEEDSMVPAENGRLLAALIKQAELTVLPGAGHGTRHVRYRRPGDAAPREKLTSSGRRTSRGCGRPHPGRS